MEDHDLMELIKAFNEAPYDDKPTTAIQFILFLDKHGFAIRRKHSA